MVKIGNLNFSHFDCVMDWRTDRQATVLVWRGLVKTVFLVLISKQIQHLMTMIVMS